MGACPPAVKPAPGVASNGPVEYVEMPDGATHATILGPLAIASSDTQSYRYAETMSGPTSTTRLLFLDNIRYLMVALVLPRFGGLFRVARVLPGGQQRRSRPRTPQFPRASSEDVDPLLRFRVFRRFRADIR